MFQHQKDLDDLTAVNSLNQPDPAQRERPAASSNHRVHKMMKINVT